ncbi:uncharacterized protein isoform X2 [Rhodnius prolixus]|uniref:uncharacterized protein isoform X2 n=1 Tax=Rhodnius prolixus TaxID=13249 RepID=UPI003D18DB3A
MACNCPTIKSIPESDKRKRSRTIPRIDANLILNLSSLITTENESSREFLMVVNEIVTSNVKVYILSERYKKFWVDFSVRSGNIQLYCSAGTGQWGKVSIDFSNVNGISCVDFRLIDPSNQISKSAVIEREGILLSV